MTAVSPYIVPLGTIIDVEDQKTWEPVSLFATNDEKKLEDIAVDDEIAPKRRMTIAEGLRPLLASMRLFGLYFNRRSEDAGDDLNTKSQKWNASAIYGATVVILLWMNAVRMLSGFTQRDTFGVLLFGKLIIVIWTIQCAVSQTVFYAACFTGRLAVVFRQPLDDSCAGHARKFSTFKAVVSWSIIMLGSAFFTYGLFFSDGAKDSMFLAPLQSHIVISNPLIPRVIVYFFLFYLLSAYTFSHAITFVLAMLFSHQFKKVNKELGSCLDNQQRQVSDLDIETFRQKHQEISMNVSHVDDCLMFSNASAFCCQLSCVIISLYMLIFYHSYITDLVFVSGYTFWLILSLLGLTLTAAGGITVHHHVSLFTVSLIYRSVIYRPKLSKLKSRSSSS